MLVFLDSADISEIERYADFIDGITTNPTLLSKQNIRNVPEFVREVSGIIQGPINVEVLAENFSDMIVESHQYLKLIDRVCVKIPCTYDGFRACRHLSNEGNMVNMTLCFSASQAVFAAACGATFVSPFVGRLDDKSEKGGLELLSAIKTIYTANEESTSILAASIRNLYHFTQAATIGVEAITVSAKILEACVNHHMTEAGIRTFAMDWENMKKA